MVAMPQTNPTAWQDEDQGEEPIAILPIRMDKRIDLAVAVALMAIGGAAIYVATGFRIGNFPDPLTSRGLPYILGGALVAGGLALALRRLRGWRDLPGNHCVSEGADDEPGHPASAARAFTIAGLGFAWSFLLRDIGFLILTPLVVSGMLITLGERKIWKVVVFPLLFSLGLWIVFALVLNLNLPLGPLSDFARSLGLVY